MGRKRLISKSLITFSLFVFVVGCLASAALAQDPQKRLMARRAARVDAMRNLAEFVRGIKIDSSTTVKDFVTQSDIINAKLSGIIQEAQEIDYKEQADGTAEVTLEVPTDSVENILGRKLDYEYKTIRATGYGAPPK